MAVNITRHLTTHSAACATPGNGCTTTTAGPLMCHGKMGVIRYVRVLKWDILTLQDCFWLCCKYILVSWHKLPLKKKKKRKESIQLGQPSLRGSHNKPDHYSFTEGFPLFTWLLMLETVAHPLL